MVDESGNGLAPWRQPEGSPEVDEGRLGMPHFPSALGS